MVESKAPAACTEIWVARAHGSNASLLVTAASQSPAHLEQVDSLSSVGRLGIVRHHCSYRHVARRFLNGGGSSVSG